MQDRGHRQLDHTADLALEIWAPTESDLLVEGARALVLVLTEGTAIEAEAEATATIAVELQGIDREDRLVRWLNEVLVLAVSEGFLFTDADIALHDGGALTARLRGLPNASARLSTELKSVTYHDLRLEQDGPTWRARIVVDV